MRVYGYVCVFAFCVFALCVFALVLAPAAFGDMPDDYAYLPSYGNKMTRIRAGEDNPFPPLIADAEDWSSSTDDDWLKMRLFAGVEYDIYSSGDAQPRATLYVSPDYDYDLDRFTRLASVVDAATYCGPWYTEIPSWERPDVYLGAAVTDTGSLPAQSNDERDNFRLLFIPAYNADYYLKIEPTVTTTGSYRVHVHPKGIFGSLDEDDGGPWIYAPVYMDVTEITVNEITINGVPYSQRRLTWTDYDTTTTGADFYEYVLAHYDNPDHPEAYGRQFMPGSPVVRVHETGELTPYVIRQPGLVIGSHRGFRVNLSPGRTFSTDYDVRLVLSMESLLPDDALLWADLDTITSSWSAGPYTGIFRGPYVSSPSTIPTRLIEGFMARPGPR